jgi:hypothetical protein
MSCSQIADNFLLCNVKIFPLLEELPQQIIAYFITEWKYA